VKPAAAIFEGFVGPFRSEAVEALPACGKIFHVYPQGATKC
jgi:hypothetical protein